MGIWIDTNTGTWGSTEGIVFLPGSAAEALEVLDSDSEIINYGRDFGSTTPVPDKDPCTYTFAHTRTWCGNPGCRES